MTRRRRLPRCAVRGRVASLAHGAPSFPLRGTLLSGHDAPAFGFQGPIRLNEGRMVACV